MQGDGHDADQAMGDEDAQGSEVGPDDEHYHSFHAVGPHDSGEPAHLLANGHGLSDTSSIGLSEAHRRQRSYSCFAGQPDSGDEEECDEAEIRAATDTRTRREAVGAASPRAPRNRRQNGHVS